MSIDIKLFYEANDKKIKNVKHKWKNSHIFSNFYTEKTPLIINGKKFNNVEHYFQTMKFSYKTTDIKKQKLLEDYMNIMLLCDKPAKIKCLGNFRKNRFSGSWVLNLKKDKRKINDIIDEYKDFNLFNEKWWNENKLKIMCKGLIKKFTTYLNLNSILKNEIHDNNYLVENTVRDKVWADGGDEGTEKNGTNYLGKILTVIHHILKYNGCHNMSKELKQKVQIRKYK